MSFDSADEASDGDDFFSEASATPQDTGSRSSAFTPEDAIKLNADRAAEQARLEEIRAELEDEDDSLGRQRRQNVRVHVQIPITIRMAGRVAPGRTRDVSATGIGFSTRFPVELDQRGEVTVEFNGWRFTKKFVIRFVKPILAGSQLGVQFEELTVEEREKLVKQVFDVQRTQLQAEKSR